MTLQEALRRERERCATRGRIAQLENKVVDIEIRSLPPTAEDGVVVPAEPTDALAEKFCELVNWHPDGTENKMVGGEWRSITFRELAKGYIRTLLSAAQAGNEQRAGAEDAGSHPAPQSETGIVEGRGASQSTAQQGPQVQNEPISGASLHDRGVIESPAHQQVPTGAQEAAELAEAVGLLRNARLLFRDHWNISEEIDDFLTKHGGGR